MRIRELHPWNLTPTEAVALQRALAARVETRAPLTCCEVIAGADISCNRFSPILYAAVVALRTSDWTVLETQTVVRESCFPYVPGLLSFRETPVLLEAFAKLEVRPDAIMLDGHGYSHPRRMGYACHVGLCLEVPTLGCAKSRLVGEAKEPGLKAGCLAPLTDRGEVIGSVVRTKTGVKPVFVSVGHRIDLPSAVRLVLGSCRGYRVPEPTRQAHLLVNELRRQECG
jgi:deoxyribonuclease V